MHTKQQPHDVTVDDYVTVVQPLIRLPRFLVHHLNMHQGTYQSYEAGQHKVQTFERSFQTSPVSERSQGSWLRLACCRFNKKQNEAQDSYTNVELRDYILHDS